MYKIGIVEDSSDETDKIERTIDFFEPNFDVEYYMTDINGEIENNVEVLATKILSDIHSGKIDGLIIDYMITLDKTIIEGNEIYLAIKKIVPKFPVIILTEIIEEPENKSYMDTDKVYKKSIFFNFETVASRDLFKKFSKNMDHYKVNKKRLSESLEQAKNAMSANGITEKNIYRIVELEKELSKYENNPEVKSETLLDGEAILKAINLIKRVDEMDKHE